MLMTVICVYSTYDLRLNLCVFQLVPDGEMQYILCARYLQINVNIVCTAQYVTCRSR